MHVLRHLFILACVVPLAAQQEVDRLTVTNASTFASFGAAIALDGSVMLVGAPGDAVPNNYTGSVYVFRKAGGAWSEEQKLTAPSGQLLDEFGRSLAVAGNVAAIGAPAPLGNNTGAVYMFRFDGSQWAHEQTISGIGDWFGWSLDLEGDRLVVGAVYSSVAGVGIGSNHAGKAFVFDYDGASWALSQTLVAGDPDVSDLFGSAVALQGSTLLVGAQGEGDNNLNEFNIGAAYAFEHDGSQWNQVQKIRASDSSESAQFGNELVLDGDIVAFGAPRKAYGAGVAYTFHRTAGVWIEDDKMRSPWPGSNESFGAAMALDNNYLMISVLNGRDTAGHYGGAVYGYRFDGTEWLREPAFQGSQTIATEQFGSDIALQGQTAVVGAWETNAGPADDGTVYVFDVSPSFHLMVSPLPMESDDDVKFEVRDAPANDFVLLAMSLAGPGVTPIPVLGLSLGIVAPQAVGVLVTDATGSAQWEFPLPASAAGIDAWFQVLRVGHVTNLIATDTL